MAGIRAACPQCDGGKERIAGATCETCDGSGQIDEGVIALSVITDKHVYVTVTDPAAGVPGRFTVWKLSLRFPTSAVIGRELDMNTARTVVLSHMAKER